MCARLCGTAAARCVLLHIARLGSSLVWQRPARVIILGIWAPITLSKGGADLTSQCNKKELREMHEHLRCATRDLARALIPRSNECWSSVHDPHPFIPVRLLLAARRNLSAG